MGPPTSGRDRCGGAEQLAPLYVREGMKIDLDILAVAVQLVREFGLDAERVARARLVECIAADNARAADFWRKVGEHADRLTEARDPAAAAASMADAGLGGALAQGRSA